uniref:sigma-70 family RNA polymerase sigma factor n=1 Tax=Agathobacter sp. TaxID=2021311 RepID=UPI0040569003
MPAKQNIERLMNEYGDAIFRMCYLYLKNYHLAEDAAQETFIKAMKRYDSFNGQSSEKTWLTRIAINCCKNTMRMNWYRLENTNLEENICELEVEPIEQMSKRNDISRAIQSLKTDDREVIVLYYYQELSMKEIAQVIGKSENVAIQRVNRARERLKKILMEVGYGS